MLGKPSESTEHFLLQLKAYDEVGLGAFKVGKNPLVSCEYANCSALVIKKDDILALAHFYPKQECALKGLAEELGVELRGLEGFLIGGSLSNLTREAEEAGLKIRESWVDDWCGRKDMKYYYPRDIIIVPAAGEINIFTHKGRVILNF